MIQLASIQFYGVQPDRTIPLRRNEASGSQIAVPEWLPTHTDPRDTPVAFRFAPAGHSDQIRVQLSRSDTSQPLDVQVRAMDATGNNILGTVPAFRAQFAPGQAAITLIVGLDNTRLTAVARHDDSWTWCYREPEQLNFQRFTVTQHRTYAILQAPFSPWDARIDEPIFWVWTDVLDVACEWASGAVNIVDASTKIRAALFEMGERGLLRYTFNTSYAYSSPFWFNCGSFLAMLRNPSLADTQLVNCFDCASIVSTLANSLGCSLWQGEMSCGTSWTNSAHFLGISGYHPRIFGRHCVAWDGQARETDRIWDACLNFQGNQGTQVPAASMVFDDAEPDDYHDRLINPRDAYKCVPLGRPAQGYNRDVICGVHPLVPDSCQSEAVRERLGDEAFDCFQTGRWPTSRWFVYNFFWMADDAAGFSLLEKRTAACPTRESQSRWYRQADNAQFRLRLTAHETRSREGAKLSFAARLAELAEVAIYQPDVGDVAFRDPDWLTATFLAGNMVVSASCSGVVSFSIERLFRQVYNFLAPERLPGGITTDRTPTRFDLPLSDDEGQPVWYRLFAATGIITRDARGLMFTQTVDGPRSVEVDRHISGANFSQYTLSLE